ncbi:Spy/CpxP family protein refolding chaperone [Jeongeupia naejangsanensis]|uniref:Spy/CpxP family protein refolding chaperone n=1 Tax=Jeongeupia naejangsanensis TaxID=613195 RepID=A0ABS2BKN4_9NEIS|nr:Spy/CpxP family protein refolding chaperone [Jeongeupia naejangsanensis]MBM3116169.1 Spy/CpxP family protein refolding chaperone [Jeongeupia naejangsanensis]
MNKSIRSLFLATAMLLPVSAAFAADASAPADSATLASVLKLTSAQQEKIQAIRDAEQKQIAAIDTSKIKPGVFQAMIKSGQWDEAQAKQRIEAVGDVDNQVTYIRAKALFDISRILTAEQRQHFQSLFAKELAAD